MDDMNLKDKLEYIDIAMKLLLQYGKNNPDVVDFLNKNMMIAEDEESGFRVVLKFKKKMRDKANDMGFEKNIYQKQYKLLMDTILRAEEQYKKLLARYVNLWGTAIGSITYGKLICVGEIMGYTHQDIQADIDRKRDAKNERV